MAIHICAKGFGENWDGTYEQIEFDRYAKMPDQDYWIFHDSWYWFISTSQYQYGEPRRLAQMEFDTAIVDPKGDYTGIDGEPDGTVSISRSVRPDL